MSLQGAIVIVSGTPAGDLVQALGAAGAFPVVEARWANAATAVTKVKPAAILIADTEAPDADVASALAKRIMDAEPIIPVLARVREDGAPAIPGALPIAIDTPAEHMIARLAAALRLRNLHATVLRRAATLKSERNIVADVPNGDPLDDATVLVVGRGPLHPALSVAVGERMGVMGALSVDFAAGCLDARELDGLVIGDGLPNRSVEALMAALAGDARFRDLPVAMLGAGGAPAGLPNTIRARDPQTLVARLVPLVRLHAFEARLKRLLDSIECKGMLDARTGLLTVEAFGRDLERAIEDAAERGIGLSAARFSFEDAIDLRASMDAARLVSRLVRNVDFACRQDDGSIVAVFTETDLRSAHVVVRRLASVLKHTMLRPGRQPVIPNVTLASLKPGDTVLTLMARIAPRPVAAE
jgi:hypothetical protein